MSACRPRICSILSPPCLKSSIEYRAMSVGIGNPANSRPNDLGAPYDARKRGTGTSASPRPAPSRRELGSDRSIFSTWKMQKTGSGFGGQDVKFGCQKSKGARSVDSAPNCGRPGSLPGLSRAGSPAGWRRPALSAATPRLTQRRRGIQLHLDMPFAIAASLAISATFLSRSPFWSISARVKLPRCAQSGTLW
jgi:hypothetical protein